MKYEPNLKPYYDNAQNSIENGNFNEFLDQLNTVHALLVSICNRTVAGSDTWKTLSCVETLVEVELGKLCENQKF